MWLTLYLYLVVSFKSNESNIVVIEIRAFGNKNTHSQIPTLTHPLTPTQLDYRVISLRSQEGRLCTSASVIHSPE